jgi:hypothetical protein
LDVIDLKSKQSKIYLCHWFNPNTQIKPKEINPIISHSTMQTKKLCLAQKFKICVQIKSLINESGLFIQLS